MNEFELKLVFPVEKFSELEKLVVSKGGLRRQRLQAFYFDTDYFDLANSGIALRIRKEGRSWVQTLKAATSSDFERLEHNVTLNHVGAGVPALNLQLHADHPAFNALTKLLQKQKLDPSALRVRYQTDIWRRAALVRARGAVLEYALDSGEIKAFQKDGSEKIVSVAELEIELKSGDERVVINHAKSLVRRFGLCVDTRSKAQRGYVAARGAADQSY
jgi:inorganic triphosphatase YgiF